MQLIAIEEHFQAPGLRRLAQSSGFDETMDAGNPGAVRLAKLDVGEERLADMDAAGIDLQVLSHTAGPMPNPSAAVELARAANEELADREKIAHGNAERLLGL